MAKLQFQVIFKEQFSVPAGSYKYITIENSFLLKGDELSQKGIFIESDNDVIVYTQNSQPDSNDGFLALPVDVIGSEYFAVTYFPQTLRCQISVVGVYNNTEVNITLSNNDDATDVTFDGVTYTKGEVINVKLNKFDALQIQSTGDLTGTYISSNKNNRVKS